jgi:hypothetical protein
LDWGVGKGKNGRRGRGQEGWTVWVGVAGFSVTVTASAVGGGKEGKKLEEAQERTRTKQRFLTRDVILNPTCHHCPNAVENGA